MFFCKECDKSLADVYIFCEVIKILANFVLKYMQRKLSYNFITSLTSLVKRVLFKKEKDLKKQPATLITWTDSEVFIKDFANLLQTVIWMVASKLFRQRNPENFIGFHISLKQTFLLWFADSKFTFSKVTLSKCHFDLRIPFS